MEADMIVPADKCDFLYVHDDIVKKVSNQMPTEDILFLLSDLLKVFADKTRIKILFVLSVSELCVCDIAALLDMGQSAISHQLSVLKQSKLVKSRREGKAVFYSLADDHVNTILNQAMEHVKEDYE